MQAISMFGCEVDLSTVSWVRMWEGVRDRHGVEVGHPSGGKIVLVDNSWEAKKLMDRICDLRGFDKATGRPKPNLTREQAYQKIKLVLCMPDNQEALEVLMHG